MLFVAVVVAAAAAAAAAVAAAAAAAAVAAVAAVAAAVAAAAAAVAAVASPRSMLVAASGGSERNVDRPCKSRSSEPASRAASELDRASCPSALSSGPPKVAAARSRRCDAPGNSASKRNRRITTLATRSETREPRWLRNRSGTAPQMGNVR